jgi:hypothetical protein
MPAHAISPLDPPHDFAKGIAQWYPTWPSNVEDRALVVYVSFLFVDGDVRTSLTGLLAILSDYLLDSVLVHCSHHLPPLLVLCFPNSDYVKMWKHC